MSKRADNIGRFISGARNLALVQLFVGLTMLGAAATGTYFIHKEIRADRIAAQASNDPIVETNIATPPPSIEASGDTVPKSDYDDLLRRANDYYDAILERDEIIRRQNEQINSGNEALGENASEIEELGNALRSCQNNATPEETICPVQVNTQPYIQEINSLKTQLASCGNANNCAPPPPPCTYDGVPCLDVIKSLQENIATRSQKDCTEEIASETSNLRSEITSCAKETATKDKMIKDLQEQLATAKSGEERTALQLPEELKNIDPEKLQDLKKQLEKRGD